MAIVSRPSVAVGGSQRPDVSVEAPEVSAGQGDRGDFTPAEQQPQQQTGRPSSAFAEPTRPQQAEPSSAQPDASREQTERRQDERTQERREQPRRQETPQASSMQAPASDKRQGEAPSRPRSTFLKSGYTTPQDQQQRQPEEEQASAQQANELSATPSEPTAPTDSARMVASSNEAMKQASASAIKESTEPEGELPVPKDTSAESKSILGTLGPVLTDPKPKAFVRERKNPAPVMSQRRDAQRTEEEKREEKRASRAEGLGNGMSSTLYSDPTLSIEEVSFGVKDFVGALKNEGSLLRGIVAEYAPEDDISLMTSSEEYAYQVLDKVFNQNEQRMLVAKYPTPALTDQHVRTVRVHPGDGARLHPLSFKVFNADADGDTITVMFDKNATYGVRSAMDYLIGPDNQDKIDDAIFDFRIWWDQRLSEDPYDQVSRILSRQIGLDRFAFVSSSQYSALAKSIVDTTTQVEGAYRDVFRHVRSIAENTTNDYREVDEITAIILKEIWEYNRWFWDAAAVTDYGYEMPESRLKGSGRANTATVLSKGELPSNYVDYSSSMKFPVGFEKKRNPHFRNMASTGKIARLTNKIKVGINSWINQNEWKSNQEEQIAKAMSGLATLGGYQFNTVTWVRVHVMKEVGAPQRYLKRDKQGTIVDMDAFLEKFRDSYNKYQYIASVSNQNLYAGYTGASNNDKWMYRPLPDDVNDYDSYASAFKQIYGDIALGTTFGPYLDLGSEFSNVTVNDFVMNSRMASFVQDLESGAKRPDHTKVNAFVKALATQRTSKYRSFHNDFNQLAEEMMTRVDGKTMTKLKKTMVDNGVDYVDASVENLYSAMSMLGPEAFWKFGMESVSSMRSNELGNAMINAKSKEELKSLVYEIHSRSKLYDSYRLMKAKDEQSLEEELDRLAQASDTWKAIVSDMRSGGSEFSKMMGPLSSGQMLNGMLPNDSSLWQKVKEQFDGKSTNVIEAVLYNRDLTGSEKEKMLNDFQKQFVGGNHYQQPYEITLDIMSEPKSLHPGDRAATDFDRGSMLDNFKASHRLLDASAKENREEFAKQVSDAKQKLSEQNPRALSQYVGKIASGEVSMFSLNRGDYVDAVAAILDPSYASTEKSSQEAAVNNLFQTLSHAINGGLWSDLTVADDFALGKISWDRLCNSPKIIAKLLTDEKFSIQVYDGSGSQTVSMATFIDVRADRDAELWKFFENYPRMAMALRHVTTSVNKPKIGGVAQVSTDDFLHSIYRGIGDSESNAMDRAVLAMANHPYFAGILSTTVQTTGVKKQQNLSALEENLEGLVMNMRLWAQEWTGDISENVRINIVEPLFGTKESMNPDFANAYALLAEQSEDMSWSDQIKEYFQDGFTRYIEELQSMGLPPVDPKEVPDVTFRLDDPGSIRRFFYVVQTLNGAQTETSTSINGGESRRNGLLSIIANKVHSPCESDVYAEIEPNEFLANWAEYERVRVKDSDVHVDVTNYVDIAMQALEEGRNVMLENPMACTCVGPCLCERHAMKDPSTNFRFKDVPALARYMLIKRADGTEALNLKRKKDGDDGTDKIVKFDVFSYVDNFMAEQIDGQISMAKDVFEARSILAQYLYDINESLGYGDLMSKNDYGNIAKYLIREYEDGSRYVMSIEEMSMACNEAVARARRQSERKLTYEEMQLAEEEFIASYQGGQGVYDVWSLPLQVKVNRHRHIFNRVTEQRMSSPERNAQLTSKLIAQCKSEIENEIGAELIMSQSKLNDTSMKYRSKYGWLGDMVPEGYKFIGVPGKEVDFAIGPTSTWVMHPSVDVDTARSHVLLAQKYGINLVFDFNNEAHRQAIQLAGVVDQTTKTPNKIGESNVWMLPFFDNMLNGKNTTGTMGATNVGTYLVDNSNLVRTVEDPFNSMGLTDSDAQATQGFVERTKIRNMGDQKISYLDMFPNMIQKHGLKNLDVSIPSYAEIRRQLFMTDKNIMPAQMVENFLKQTNPDGNGRIALYIDPGRMLKKGEQMTQEEKDAIYKYMSRFDEYANERGWLVGVDVEPGDVVGFVRGRVGRAECWHAVKAYDLKQSKGKRAPQRMKLVSGDFESFFDTNVNKGFIQLTWVQEEPILGSSFKVFEGEFAANKLIARPDLPKHMPKRQLANGHDVDLYVAENSTASRRSGGFKDMQLMCTLMAEARTTAGGYNFADDDLTFPGRDDVREGLRNGTIPMSEWDSWLSAGDMRFMPAGHPSEAKLNALMNKMARAALSAGINPSDVFASRFDGLESKVWFRFEAVFDGSSQFKQGLMEWFNFMDPTLCPKSPGDFNNDTLFNGQLQMLVPFTRKDGEVFYSWANVYTGLSFLDDHYSGFREPGRTPVGNSSKAIDITLSYGGKFFPEEGMDSIADYVLYSVDSNASSYMIVNEDDPDGETEGE